MVTARLVRKSNIAVGRNRPCRPVRRGRRPCPIDASARRRRLDSAVRRFRPPGSHPPQRLSGGPRFHRVRIRWAARRPRRSGAEAVPRRRASARRSKAATSNRRTEHSPAQDRCHAFRTARNGRSARRPSSRPPRARDAGSPHPCRRSRMASVGIDARRGSTRSADRSGSQYGPIDEPSRPRAWRQAAVLRAAIWSSASTTASKVRSVEAWRAR